MLNGQRRTDRLGRHAPRLRTTRVVKWAVALAILAASFGGFVATEHSHAAPTTPADHGWALADHWSTTYLWAQPDGAQAPAPHAQPPAWVNVTP